MDTAFYFHPIFFFAFKIGKEVHVIPVSLFHTRPLKIILEVVVDTTANIAIEIGSIQARSYFKCVRSPPYSTEPAK